MPTVSKFTVANRVGAIELAESGYTYREIAERLGVGHATLERWRKRDATFDKSIKEARSRGLSGIIENGLRRLAMGAEREEYSEEYDEVRELGDNTKRIVKIKKRRVILPPNEKAISILAMQHAKHYANDKTESVTNILNVNTSDYSMREVQESLANSPIEANDYSRLELDVELDANDYEELATVADGGDSLGGSEESGEDASSVLSPPVTE